MSVECARCGDEAEPNTQKCSNCEYRPQKSMQLVGFFIFIAGIVVSATGIGAIVGVPMAVFGIYRVFKGKNLTIESEYGV
nr:hypothetical protein 15 [bacterium]